jgi:monovalent cation/hydrogen antiporter
VLVMTFVVIVVTLVAQGLTLPWVLRRLGLDRLGLAELRRRKEREMGARVETARAALAQLDAAAMQERLPADVVEPWRERQRQRIAALEGAREPDGGGFAMSVGVQRAELALIGAARARLNDLLREGSVSDEIRRRIERDFDLDEERLRRNVHGIATDDEDADETPGRA